MSESTREETISGLRARMQSIVNDLKGQYSEVEIIKEMMREGELMLATCNVRNLFTSNLDMCECGIRNEETGEVKMGMKKLADSVDVVSVLTQADDVCCNSITTINFTLSEKLIWQFMVVYNRVINENEDGSLETLIHYQLQAGHIDEELKDIIDFEFTHHGLLFDDCSSCGSSCCCEEEPEEMEKDDKHDEHETEDSDDEEEDEVKNLSFDLDVMDKFTKESNAGISSEDLLCYLISMEFWEANAAIAERLDPIIDEIRNPDPEANVIDV
ncbi:hypothetical protein WA588_002512 [Blastocystis sp. NMH]